MFKVRMSAFQLVYLSYAVVRSRLQIASDPDQLFDVSFDGMNVSIIPVKK